MWLRIKLFVIFSVLMVLCVTTVSITIVKMTTNLYMKEVEATGKRDLMLITSSLESTLQRISNTAVSIVSDSRIIAAVKQYPNGPRTESEKAVLKNLREFTISWEMSFSQKQHQSFACRYPVCVCIPIVPHQAVYRFL